MYLASEDSVRAALYEADKLVEAQRIELEALRKDAERIAGRVPDWHLCKESVQLCRRVLARCEVT